ncbi:MAG: CHASE2 domain-containing protein [Leptolyngbyaceae cyanobacterium bins.302]|nr:CHASE2 domain-containing protein [Leptolyngbyaceae cyanobacterium bins.302]
MAFGVDAGAGERTTTVSTQGKLVILKLDGDLERQGLFVTAQIGRDGDRPSLEVSGALPAAPDLVTSLQRWQQVYWSLGTPTRIMPQEIIYGGFINRLEECRHESHELRQQLNDWLESHSFRAVDQHLRESLSLDDPIRIIIRTQNEHLRRIPWHLWNLVDRYTKAEVALGAQQFQQIKSVRSPRPGGKVRILAILGNGAGINLESDHTLLQQLPHADVSILVEPLRRQMNQHLWEQSWDILFFAGHSQSEADQGRIYLNSQDSLTLEELKYGLRQAIAQGLQLAIFNSCDGLGLAQELEQLHLPQMIVMREPVPDPVAQEFLQHFLTAFVDGEPLYLATRQARERLQGLEGQFPCASWLPVICQSSLEQPLNWQGLVERDAVEPDSMQLQARTITPHFSWRSLRFALLTSWVVTTFVVGLRLLGGLQMVELAAFDHFLRSRPQETLDDRLLLITVDEADLHYQDQRGMQREGSLSNQALQQLLVKLNRYRPAAIGLDIYREQAIASNLNSLRTPFNSLIVVCTIGGSANSPDSIAPPPGFSPEQVGFGDTPLDSDRIIRRQYIGASSNQPCNTDKSLNYLLARRYLQRQGIPPVVTNETVSLGGRPFPNLERHHAAYQREDMAGYDVLLNYRATEKIASQVALAEILAGQVDAQLPELVRDRVVMIGTLARSFKDYHQTPLGEMAGVEVQAHMVSQLLSAVLDGRPLIWYLPPWAEVVWIGGWAMVGAILGLQSRSRFQGVLLGCGAGVGCLVGVCLLLFLRGGWVPLVPSALAFVGSGYSVVVYRKFA